MQSLQLAFSMSHRRCCGLTLEKAGTICLINFAVLNALKTILEQKQQNELVGT